MRTDLSPRTPTTLVNGHLKRHQLEGVIAHEFSHIVNGDMRLNIEILGILTGVQAISLVARYLLRLAMPSSDTRGGHAGLGHGKPPLGMALALVFGLVIWPIGQIGSLFAMLIHLAVNRQREFLADASAVQFTRDPQGLCEALALLLEEEAGGQVRGLGPRPASYMFFASCGGRWERLFETHPPIRERIRRLDPALETAGNRQFQAAPIADPR